MIKTELITHYCLKSYHTLLLATFQKLNTNYYRIPTTSFILKVIDEISTHRLAKLHGISYRYCYLALAIQCILNISQWMGRKMPNSTSVTVEVQEHQYLFLLQFTCLFCQTALNKLLIYCHWAKWSNSIFLFSLYLKNMITHSYISRLS